MKNKKDYCTLVPDGDWAEDCKRHDVGYAEVKKLRKTVDLNFRRDLLDNNKFVSWLYYHGVRIFGRLFV